MADDAATDRRVIRRALAAGGVIAGVVSAFGVVGLVVSDADGALGLALVLAGLTLGALITAAWLLLSVVFDLLAGRSPGSRRLWWGLGIALLAFVGPIFVLGALSAAAN